MSWSTEFEALMPDSIVVSGLASISTDGYGTAVFAASGSTYKARVTHKQQLVRTFLGTEELAKTIVWIASTSTFSPDSQLTISGSTVGPLMSLEAVSDEDGIHHLKAFFG